jgi:hypothetical protein
MELFAERKQWRWTTQGLTALDAVAVQPYSSDGKRDVRRILEREDPFSRRLMATGNHHRMMKSDIGACARA